MHILVFNWRSFLSRNAGGAETHCFEIFNRIAGKGHKVQLVASCDSTSFKHATVGKIDVLHICKSEFLYPLFSMVCLPKLPLVSSDVIVEDVSKFPIFWPLFLSKILNKPFVVIVHHVHGKTLFKELSFPFNLLSFLIELLGLKFYTLFKPYIVVVSESTKRELVSIGFNEESISIVPNGLNFEFSAFFTREKSVFPLVVYFGRVKKYKRIDHLIKATKYACEKISDLKLIVAGKGDAKVYSELRDLARQIGLESVVKFYGEVDEKTRNELFQEAWIYAFTSMKEGFGLSLIEAQAYGLPVVAYAVPGVVDAVRHMFSGILVEEGNIQALAKALELICKDHVLREKLSRGAVENASHYSWDKSAEEFLNLLTAKIKRKSA
ncbi:MAG: glycosyltransferase family 4 protein [Candidatus Bathyarchaeia archaeon]